VVQAGANSASTMEMSKKPWQ